MTNRMLRSWNNRVETFESDVQKARDLVSPNKADELFIKVAIIGYGSHSAIGEWTFDDFELVKHRVRSELPEEELQEYGVNSENIKLFYALCLGDLLGRFRAGLLDDFGLRRAEIQIPGIIMMHLERLTHRKWDGST